jgi:P27 family predicted phage terminase small subunit
MAKGRPRKPTKIKEMQGTLEKSRTVENEMMPSKVNGIPHAPQILLNIERAADLWDELVNELSNLDMLHGVDLPILTAYCIEMANYMRLEAYLTEEGRTFETPNGFEQKRPEVNMSRECLDRALKLATQFGLTPVARTKISMPTKDGGDELDKILNS